MMPASHPPRICIFDRPPPEEDRWVPGDRYVRPFVRRLLRRRPSTPGGLDKVRINLALGLDRIGADYLVNPPFGRVRPQDWVCVLGRGAKCLRGYRLPNRIVGGIGMVTHPSEWPRLFQEFPMAAYLQHCAWCRDLADRYFPGKCVVWPVGIDVVEWHPASAEAKRTDFLLYDKVRWEHERYERELIQPVRDALAARGLTCEEIRYGRYHPEQYHAALDRCRAMLFLCEHESQGIAYQEAMASGVPVLAWDQGRWLDPGRFAWGTPDVPATSVPYFDGTCGLRFRDAGEFPERLEEFAAMNASGRFTPRDYVLAHLTPEKCARDLIDILRMANN